VDKVTSQQRSEIMRQVKSTGTSLERLVQKALRHHRVYFAKNVKSIVGNPDLVFRRKKLLVFIDSCFWHGCPEHCRVPSSRTEYWHNKISRNKQRDKHVNLALKQEGWKILRFWEHELNDNFDSCVSLILQENKR
jgi:DNA mismatch endonuclease (patch repair protein)